MRVAHCDFQFPDDISQHNFLVLETTETDALNNNRTTQPGYIGGVLGHSLSLNTCRPQCQTAAFWCQKRRIQRGLRVTHCCNGLTSFILSWGYMTVNTGFSEEAKQHKDRFSVGVKEKNTFIPPPPLGP